MKALNVQKKQILFAALLLSLGVSKSWTMAAGTGHGDYFSEVPGNTSIIKVQTTVKVDGQDRAINEDVSVRVEKRPETVQDGIDSNGAMKYVEKKVAELHFSTPNCANCMEPKKIELGEIGLSAAALNTMATEAVVKKVIAEAAAEKELAKKRGNLADRKKRAESCRYEMIDENDVSKDRRLSQSERVECLAEQLDKKDYDTERKQYTAVTNALKRELQDMIFNKDNEVRSQAAGVLEDLQNRFGNEMLEDYFHGMELVNQDVSGIHNDDGSRDVNGLFDNLEIIQTQGFDSPAGMQARMAILRAQMPYLTGAYGYNLSGETRAGISDLRQIMLTNLQNALKNPAELLAQNNNSVLEFDRGSGATRHDIDINSFPMNLTFSNGTSRSGAPSTGNVQNNMQNNMQNNAPNNSNTRIYPMHQRNRGQVNNAPQDRANRQAM